MTSEEISKEIFYKPATNGQAENSIKEGAALIDNHVKEKLSGYQDVMTLRDAFAAKAMQGIVSTLSGQEQTIYFNLISKDAYDLADAMMEQRKL